MQISKWDQMRLDLGEISLEELAKKYRYTRVSPRQMVINVLLVAMMLWSLLLAAISSKLVMILCSLGAMPIAGYLLYWNNAGVQHGSKG